MHPTVASLTRARLRTLFEDQRDRLYRMLYRLTGNASDAEDLLQDAFLAVWRKRDRFDGRGSLEGFLRKTAMRQFLNANAVERRRSPVGPKHVVERTSPAADADAEREDARQFLARHVSEAIDALPEGQREAFVLFRFENLTCAQIASMTDTPVKTVETRLRRATQALARRLGPLRDHVPAP